MEGPGWGLPGWTWCQPWDSTRGAIWYYWEALQAQAQEAVWQADVERAQEEEGALWTEQGQAQEVFFC